MQETYLKIWSSAGQFNPALASPITWMVTIARNRAIDLVRKRSEASIEEEPEAMDVAADTSQSARARELSEDLKRLMACIGGSSRSGRDWCCLPITTAGAANSSRPSSANQSIRSRPGCAGRLIEIRECLGS